MKTRHSRLKTDFDRKLLDDLRELVQKCSKQISPSVRICTLPMCCIHKQRLLLLYEIGTSLCSLSKLVISGPK